MNWFVTGFKSTQRIYQKIAHLLTVAESPKLAQLQSLTPFSAAFGIQPISASVITAGRERGGNPLGLSPVNQTWFHIDAGWWFPSDDVRVIDTFKSIIAEIETATQTQEDYLPYLFINDANESQDVIAHYGADNVSRLKDVQAKYDPWGIFQRLVPGGFRLE